MLQETLNRFRFGEVESHENLSIVPLLTDEDAEPRYLLMQDALQQGLLVIEEVSAGGSVNTIKATNTATLPVLLPDSEELVGAKQNRVLNVSILLAPQTTTLIPVTCVEQGRWGFRPWAQQRAMAFEASMYMLHAEVRAAKAQQVFHRRRLRGEALADQAAIWFEVRRKQHEAAATRPQARFTMSTSIVATTSALTWKPLNRCRTRSAQYLLWTAQLSAWNCTTRPTPSARCSRNCWAATP